MRPAQTFSAVSKDGTEVTCEVAGSGPPLILVHGTADDRLGFDRLAPLIGERLTVYMMDRRGRGLSKDLRDYAIEREFEDIDALAAAIAKQRGKPTDLFAHSYGALCAIGSARTSTSLGRLMLYEPPPGTPSTLVERMAEFDAQGDYEGVMRVQFCELQHMPPTQFERLKADQARWARYLDFAKTISREFVNARRFRMQDGEFAAYPHAVRFIVGEKSFPVLVSHTETALRAFPGADKAVLPGQGHNALRQGPETVAAEIIRFFV
jgi:pimeloyl-ACP methyl ester carboxylesterase